MDTLAEAVRNAWARHADAIAAKADDVTLQRLFIEVLEAERALEVDSLAVCTQPGAASMYAATIADYNARIEDETRVLLGMVR